MTKNKMISHTLASLVLGAATWLGAAPAAWAVTFEVVSLAHPDLPLENGLTFHAKYLNNAGIVAGRYQGYAPWGQIRGSMATLDVSNLSSITASVPRPDASLIALSSQNLLTYAPASGTYTVEPSGQQIAWSGLPIGSLSAINDAGVVTGSLGWFDTVSGTHGTFVVDGLTPDTLSGVAINHSGQILGRGYKADGSMQSFFYDTSTGQGHRLAGGLLSGPQYSPHDINDAGVMVVTDFGDADLKLYLVTADGLATNINAVPGGRAFSRSGTFALNNSGQLVSANYFYDGTSWIDLAQATGFSVQYPGQFNALDINDHGQILFGYNRTTSSPTQFFLLNPSDVAMPIPEPATTWLMGLGLLGVAAAARRRLAPPTA